MEILLLLIRLFLVAIFLLAGVGKLLDLEGSEKAVKAFGTPEEYAKTFAVALPFAEIVFAVCLLFVETSWLGAIGGLILLLSFIGGMIWQLAQGNAPDCHCFGAIHSEPVSRRSLIRNVIFAILALFLVAQGRENQGLSVTDSGNDFSEGNFMSVILSLAIIGLLVAAVFYLKKISEQQRQIMRRIEILELTAQEGGRELVREELIHPQDGLPVGAPAPDFALPDLNGKTVTLEQLLMRRKPILLFFVSPTCNPCKALLPEIEAWLQELKDKVSFVFISSGKAKENAEKFAGEAFKQILLQKEREVAELYFATWTPTAFLVNADGNVGSEPAFGDVKIRELIEKIKAETAEVRFITNGKGQNIGEAFPEFSLSDVTGKTLDASALRGRKTLVTYWSNTCGYCAQMLEELREWDKTKGASEPNLLLLSRGEVEKNLELGFKSTIVLDDEREVVQKLGMEGTPSAVLVDENGRIASQIAVGEKRIWALIGKRK
ncbi:MAG: redoxin domain-containing protein [Acidobacteriota bacterium]|nr:redoxin domain-containing protein [Acidobacteriota bacterium]